MSDTALTALHRLISDVSDYLAIEKDLGLNQIELAPETYRGLRSRPARGVSPSPRDTAPASAAVSAAPASFQGASSDAESRMTDIIRRMDEEDPCGLKKTATRIVPGQGSLNPELVFIGEAPGEEEDRQGLAFVGRSGELLTRMLKRAGMSRDEVWIGNIVKWRPPNNRTPTLDEIHACMPFLVEQLDVLKPKVIMCLGGTAIKGLLGTTRGIMSLRGTWQEFNGIPVMPTYHPSFLLRSRGDKKQRFDEVWSDMVKVLEKLGRSVPEG